MKQNWWQVMLYSYDDLGGDPWFEIAIATNRISLDMFKLCDPKLISSTVPLLLKVKVKGLTHKRGVDCGDACGPCYREGGKSHPKNMQFFPYMSILFASYLFVGFCLSLCWYSHDIVSYFGVSSDPWYYTYIYLLSLSYLSAWIYLICLFVPFAKVGSLPKWISNRSSIMSWGARVLSFETGLMVALTSEETALLDRAWCGQKCGLEGP